MRDTFEVGQMSDEQSIESTVRFKENQFFICYDDNNCEIKSGQEDELACNFEKLTQELSSRQKEALFEPLLGGKFLTEEHAEKVLDLFDTDGKETVIKYILKVLKPEVYKRLVFNYFEFIKRRYDEVLEMEEPNEVDYKDAGRLHEMVEFIINQAPDRYADIAVFDNFYGNVNKAVGRKKPKKIKVQGYKETETPAESRETTKSGRVKEFINDYESANRAVEALKNCRQNEEQQKILFYHLVENFPEVVLKNFKELFRFVSADRHITKSELINRIIKRTNTKAFQAAEEKYPQHIPHHEKIDFFWKQPRYEREPFKLIGGEYEARRQELIKKEEARIGFEMEEEFLLSLPSEEAKFIFDLDNEESPAVESGWLRNLTLKHFSIFFKDKSPAEIYKAAKRFISESFYINSESFKFLQSHGLEDRFVREALKGGNVNVFKELYDQGEIKLLKPNNIKNILKMWEKIDYLILLENPEILAEYRLIPPKEKMLPTLPEEHYFNQRLKKYLEYAAKTEESSLPKAYRLSKKEIAVAVEVVLRGKPEIICEIDEEIINYLDKRKVKSALAETIEKLETQNTYDFFRMGAMSILKEDDELREMVVEKMRTNPRIIVGQWGRARDFFKNESDMLAYLEDNLEIILNDTEENNIYFDFINFLKDLKLDEKMLDKTLHKALDSHRALIPEILHFFSRNKQYETKDEELKKELGLGALDYFKDNPTAIFNNVSKLEGICAVSKINKSELNKIIRENFKKVLSEQPELIWSFFDNIVTYLGEEEALRFFWDGRYELADEICMDTKLEGRHDIYNRNFSNSGRRSEFIKKMVDSIIENQPVSLYSNEGDPRIVTQDYLINEPHEIVYKWIQKQVFFSFFEKELRNYYTASAKLPKNALHLNFMKAAKECMALSASPAREIFLTAAKGLPKKAAMKFLDAAYGLVEIKKDEEWLAEVRDLKGAEEINSALFEKLKSELASAIGDLPDDIRLDSRLLERPVALIVYAESYKNQPEVLSSLKEAAKAELRGVYKDWRYFGENESESGLDHFKELKFLPQNLTLRQYEEWARDERIEKEIELNFDANDISNKNKEIINNSAAHGHYELKKGEDIFNTEANQGRLQELESPLKEIQAELSEYEAIVKKNKERKKQKLPLIDFDRYSYQALKNRRDEYLKNYQNEIDRLRAYEYLRRLTKLNSQEIMQGGLGDKNKKGVFLPFERIFSHLLKTFKEYQEFLVDIDNIKNNIYSLTSTIVGKNKFSVTDETDFMISLEIGEKPVSSCQNWRKNSNIMMGNLNKGLVAYVVEPSVKIFTVRTHSGNLVARAVARLLSDKNGEPVLYLEPVYSANPSQQIEKIIIDFGVIKAEKMGVSFAQYAREGGKEESGQARDSSVVLSSYATRSKYSYVDSAHGIAEDGKFVIKLI